MCVCMDLSFSHGGNHGLSGMQIIWHPFCTCCSVHVAVLSDSPLVCVLYYPMCVHMVNGGWLYDSG